MKMVRLFFSGQSRGLELIELALIAPFAVAAVLAVVDVANIVRTNMALGEAVSAASLKLRALDHQGIDWESPDERVRKAREYAEREIAAVLPRVDLECEALSSPHCLLITIEPTVTEGRSAVRVKAEYALPVMVVSRGFRILSRELERRMEASYAPTGEPHIGNARGDKP